jgi:GMP synthase (glutamine-hydrolysing)
MRALVVQHVPYEGPALLAELAAAHGATLDVIHPYRGDPVPPALGAHDALIVLGGPMGVYEADRHPHLRDEMALLRASVAAGAPVLGICLGSQLLAAAHGADVRASGRQEIGFHDVTLARDAADDPLFAGAPRTITPMHWHGDVFELPRGAIALASSAMTTHQAFRLAPRAWGVLFHLEVTPAWIQECSTAFEDELRAHAIDPDVLRASAVAGCAAMNATAREVLGRFFKLVDPGR